MRRCRSVFVAGVLAGVAVGVAATAALAADLPVPAAKPAYYPLPPASYNWSGIYFGGNVGGGFLNDLVTFSTTTPLENAGTTTRLTPFSVIGGAQVGFNAQFGPVVAGVEGTWTSSAITGNTPIGALDGSQEESRSAPHWFGTATGRLGYAFNDVLLYAKGGGAWMHVDYTQINLIGGVNNGQQLISDTRDGYTVGGGIEYAFNENLSAKLEYDFLDFGTKNYNFTAMNGGAGLPVSIRSSLNVLTAGLNYRFYFGGFGQ
jgi:outer membrane immunogenic protein